ncbi:hypothetical protein WJX84_010074 [Apatococcus fuscideae]
MIQKAGKAEASFQLHELLVEHGQERKDIAAEARAAIFERNERAFRCTLATPGKDGGGLRHTLFEMWPTVDSGNTLQAAMFVNSFNVTEQKQLECELAAAKLQLLRQNAELEASNGELKANEVIITSEKECLQAQKQELQKHLKLVLQTNQIPHTSMDTMTIAEKIVSALDQIVEGERLPLEDVIELRNAIMKADDLRKPADLKDQLLYRAGLSTDVGLAMTEMLQGDSNRGASRLAANRSTTRASDSRELWARSNSFDECALQIRHAARQWKHGGNDDSSLKAQMTLLVIPHVERLLMEAGSSLAFDAFELAEATGNRPLSTLGFFFIKGSGLTEAFHIPESKLAAFLQHIEAGYVDHPYHNRVHATAVLQVMHMLMQNGLIRLGVLQDVMILACYLSAICHDFEHPGVNNDFLVKTSDRKALLYNDISPLENHHVSASFFVAAEKPQADIFANMQPEDRGTLRASMIDLILGTDMKKHFGLLSRFQAFSNQMTSPSTTNPVLSDATKTGQRTSIISAEHTMLIAQVALKCADIGHLTCPQALHIKWTEQLREEFFRQGDQEEQRNLKKSPLMDRNEVTGMTKSQVGFFEIVALPLFAGYVQVIPNAKPLLDAVKSNYRFWHAAAAT